MYTPWGLKIQNNYQTHHHHHRCQNRPHRKTFTHPQGPPEPPNPDSELLGGSEGLIGPPLPRLQTKEVPAVEHLLYGQQNQYVHTANRKTNMVNQTCLNIIYIKFCVLKANNSLNYKF